MTTHVDNYGLNPPSEPHPSEPWMITHTGLAFVPGNPNPSMIVLEDIAHALAHTCRYGGHVARFYSVAEHSVLMFEAARAAGESVDVQIAALMHDASEAYVLDVPRPLKVLLGDVYRRIEDRVTNMIRVRFQLADPDNPWVKEADNRILADERAALLPRSPPDRTWTVREPLGVTIHAWTPEVAKLAFLEAAASVGLA